MVSRIVETRVIVMERIENYAMEAWISNVRGIGKGF